MTDSEWKDCAQVMGQLWPRLEMNDARVSSWRKAVDAFAPLAVQDAMSDLYAGGERYPTPGKVVGKVRAELRGERTGPRGQEQSEWDTHRHRLAAIDPQNAQRHMAMADDELELHLLHQEWQDTADQCGHKHRGTAVRWFRWQARCHVHGRRGTPPAFSGTAYQDGMMEAYLAEPSIQQDQEQRERGQAAYMEQAQQKAQASRAPYQTWKPEAAAEVEA